MISLPPDWTETIKPYISGPYGYYWRAEKRIVIYSPAWLSGWRLRIFMDLTRKHERGHAWGIKGCKKPWCLMFEAEQWKPEWKDVWWEKLAGLLMIFNGFRFCSACTETIKQNMDSGVTN